ncbi:MFS Git1p-related glycerophosphoinositol and glycerophosphocholine permease [Trametopsis cervina]|nr:MFS Git1p-related glycerophosphoinositol and glycerophosphocholine permease [Trametopsis cervina]
MPARFRKSPQLKQVSLIFACGTALFADGYANGVISAVNTILTRLYGSAALKAHNSSTTLTSVTFAGTIVGMLTFGYLSDKLGRKFGMMMATGFVAFFSLLSAASSGAHHSLGGMLAMLSACRFLLGIGIGAEYSCGSVAASEQSEEDGVARNAQHRWLALATNSVINLGFVFASFVPLVLFWIFGEDHLRVVWRLSLGLAFVPAMLVFLWRLNMDEPQHYKRASLHRARTPYWLVFKRYWVPCTGIALAWFFYDFIVYPFGIFATPIINNITGGNESLTVVLGWGCVINLFSMPGTILGAFIVDYLGPKYTLIGGLLCQAVIGFIMSAMYKHLTSHVGAFAVVYGIFLSFGELGPGNCTFLLASKTGPTGVRGQFFGFAAATGKLGAFVGTWAFPAIIDAFGGQSTDRGNTGPFWIGSGIAILSALVVFVMVWPLSHDGMIEEDEKFKQYLIDNGYDVSLMGFGAETTTTTGTVAVSESEEKSASMEDVVNTVA